MPLREVLKWRAAPWNVAYSLFGDPKPESSGALDTVGWVRSVLGMLTMVVLGSGNRGYLGTVEEEGWDKAVTTVIIALCAIPVAVAVVHRLTWAPFRPALRLGRLVGRVVLLLVTTFGLMTPIILAVRLTAGRAPEPSDVLQALLGLVITLVAIAYGLWAGAYVLSAALLALRSSCFVGDYHPLLGPAVTAAVVTTTTAITLIGFDTHGVGVDLWLVLTLGGLVTTVALAAAEHHLLRARHGIGWRTGPLPQRGQEPGRTSPVR